MKRRSILLLVLALLVIAFSTFSCNLRRFTDTRDSTIFEQFAMRAPAVHPQLIRYRSPEGRTMRYLKVGVDTLPTLVFIHGAPSSIKGWANFYLDSTLLKQYRIIAIDRPGYGKSDYGEVVTDLQKQAALIKPIFDLIDNGKEVTIVGSSYGGTITARLLMDYPGIADKAVLLSASLKPGAEKTYGISYLMKTPIIKYIFPKFLRLATYEKFSHYDELSKMNAWDRIKIPVLIIQGDKDDLIYPDNADYAKERLKNALVEMVVLPGRGHGLQFSEPATIKSLFWNWSDHLALAEQALPTVTGANR
ncbi:MAG: alpha/beta fold hydrolase [Saprospiraceae bacterium]